MAVAGRLDEQARDAAPPVGGATVAWTVPGKWDEPPTRLLELPVGSPGAQSAHWLRHTEPLTLVEDKSGATYVRGLRKEVVNSEEEALIWPQTH